MKFIVLIVVGFILSIAQSACFSQIWEWFLVAKFNLPSLSIPMVIGITCLIGLLKGIPDYKDDGDEWAEELFKRVFLDCFMMVYLLIIAAIVKQFI